MAGLKYNDTTPKALKFNRPLGISEGSAINNFLDWTRNTEQPSSGIDIQIDRIIISKFKPNVPIVTSDLVGSGSGNTPTADELAYRSRSINMLKLMGMTDAVRAQLTEVSKTNLILTWWNARLVGPCILPYNTSVNAEINVVSDVRQNVVYTNDTTQVLADELTLRGDAYGYGAIGHLYNKTSYSLFMPEWKSFPSGGIDHHWQVAIIIYTNTTPDADGTITLANPIIIKRQRGDTIDPSTIEGFDAYVEEQNVYHKERTFENALIAHKLAFKETGTYYEDIQGLHDQIINDYNGESNVAYVISGRNYDFAYTTGYPYSEPYDNVRFPIVTNLSNLVTAGFPFKVWADLTKHHSNPIVPDLSRTIYDTFYYTSITDPKFADHLFAKSKGDYTDFYVTFNLGLDREGYDTLLASMGSMFDHSSLATNLHITFNTGNIKSLHNTFRQTQGISNITFNKTMNVCDFVGAFEGSSLVNYPNELMAVNSWPEITDLSEPVCDIHYALDGSALTRFGNYQNASASTIDTKHSTITVAPMCYGAFRSGNLLEIRHILDMKFVEPVAWNIIDDGPDVVYNNAVFYAPNLVTAYIKNLNKGSWSLDGVKRYNAKNENLYAGNLESLNADSINYMLSNVFDLRQNTSDTAHFENDTNSFNGWSVTGDGWNLPIEFNAYGDCNFFKTITGGTMKFNLALSNCSVTLVNNGNTKTLTSGDHTEVLDSGYTVFSITKNQGADTMSARILLTDPFKSELTRGLSSANLYLPASASGKITSSALSQANARGWTIYVGGSIYTI